MLLNAIRNPGTTVCSRWGILVALAVLLVSAATDAPAQTKPTPAQGSAAPPGREGAWLEVHQTFLDRAKKGEIDLLFVGDSITAGWGGVAPTWDRFYAPRRAANFGIGGDGTEQVLWRLEHGEIDGIAPKVVVLLIGTNNLGGNTPAEIAVGVSAIVSKLRTKLPKSKILLLGVFPRAETRDDPVRARIQALNARIARLDDGKSVAYLDIGRHFLDADGTISTDVMPDFLHLTPHAYRLWADALEPTLWELMEGK